MAIKVIAQRREGRAEEHRLPDGHYDHQLHGPRADCPDLNDEKRDVQMK